MQLSGRVGATPFVRRPVTSPGWLRRSLFRASCMLWGHHVDNRVFRTGPGAHRQCRCGTTYLVDDGSVTRVRHTLKCFLGHHTYRRLVDRDGYHEYVCIVCGHPLLFREDGDPYDHAAVFKKKVRYLCGLFGHWVVRVTARDGFSEYACHCGHTFLKGEHELNVIRHPAVCVMSGHYLRFVVRREGFTEYVCRNCGHPFCFVAPQVQRGHA
jgi:DNA-directed RNA polymerase subunit RPC12/RpoP